MAWKRKVVGVLVLGFALGSAHPAAAERFEQTCTYFEAIAFNDKARAGYETFRMGLARDCRAALTMLQTSEPGREPEQARAYLAQLQVYRTTLLSMTMERFEQQRAGQEQARRAFGGRVMVRPVSQTGAFLIARSMGLVAAQKKWAVWTEARAK